MKNHKKAEYAILFMDNKLSDHLEEVQEIAIKRFDEIIKSLKEKNSKPIKKYDGKDENYLKENKIKVVTEEVAKKKKPKKEELPILKENKKIIGIEKIDKKN